MSVLATLALAASAATLPQCSWDKPGANPFMGDLVAAVDHYPDIPPAVRAKLKERMQVRHYDEIVEIRRDSIQGKGQYAAEISEMHFGAGSVCRTVTRNKWPADALERGLVYCEDGYCILVPTVCRNVSRIRRVAAPVVAKAEEPQDELVFEPPGAGVPAGSAAPASPSFAQLSSPLPTTRIASAPPSVLTPPTTLVPGTPTLPPSLPPTTPPVPEPESWAMLLAGLGAVLWIAKRRSRN
jgi:hypothetical protein